MLLFRAGLDLVALYKVKKVKIRSQLEIYLRKAQTNTLISTVDSDSAVQGYETWKWDKDKVPSFRIRSLGTN
jgi:hypothetical protein